MLDKKLVRHVLRAFVYGIQHFSILFESLLMELLVCIDLVAFRLEDPTQCFGVHVVYIVLMELKRIGVIFEDLIVVNLGEMFAE